MLRETTKCRKEKNHFSLDSRASLSQLCGPRIKHLTLSSLAVVLVLAVGPGAGLEKAVHRDGCAGVLFQDEAHKGSAM